ncbi:MAG: hypothetical protein ACYC2Y_01350 [Armatimonadota bacterium]
MKRFRFSPYPLLLWAVVLMLASASGYVDTIGIIFYCILGVPLFLGLGFLWPKRWQVRHPRNWIAIPLALALILSVAATMWPLRLHYLAARPALDRIADRLETGERVKTPVWAGLFRINEVEIYRDIPCLWVGNYPSGGVGLIRTPPDGAYRFNLWEHIRLDDTWQFISED